MIHKKFILIDILKKKIEKKIGKKVTNRRDCELISDVILETLEEEISYSTIRRLYGLDNETKPNNKTLNTLAKFVGYNNYAHFIQTYNIESDNNFNFQVFKVIFKMDHQEIIKLVKTTKKSEKNFSDFIIVLVRELFHNKNYYLLNKIFQLDEMKYNTFSYSEILYIGNSIGLLIKTSNKIDNLLLSNVNFIECVFLTFVDYSGINNYYGKAAKIISVNHKNKEIKLFAIALLEFKNFLNKKKVSVVKLDLVYSNKLHPILCGRLIALYIFKDKNLNNELIITNYLKFNSKKTNLIDYYYELFVAAILTKNRFLMSSLISKIDLKSKTLFLYQKFHLNIFYLMCLFFYKLENNKSEEIRFSQLYIEDNCTIGYLDFIKALHLIYLYADEKQAIKKQQIENDYLQLIKDFNYPYLNYNFLINYFK